MFDSKQKVTLITTDERVIPTTGLITTKELLKFCNSTWSSPMRIDIFIKNCEESGISIFKLLPEEPGTWLIRLDDFAKCNPIINENQPQ